MATIPEEPQTDLEQYLNRIATGEGEYPAEPHTNVEQYLNYIIENGGGGGGGTSNFNQLTNRPKYNGTTMTGETNIPAVVNTPFTGTDGTSAGTAGLVPAPVTTDAGKFLKADGTWGTAGGSGPTVVQTTGTSTTDVMSQNAVTSTVFADPATQKKIAITNASKSGAGEDSIAIGDNATATNQYSIAIGNVAPATGKRAIAIGDKTSTASTAATGSSSISIGTNTQATGTSSVAICTRSVAGADGAIAIGAQATTNDEKSVSMGFQAKGHGANAIAIGSSAKTAPLNSDQGYNAAIAIGLGSSAFGVGAVAIGVSADAYTGNQENIEVPYGIAIGGSAAAKKDGAISAGYYSSASGKGSVALGPYANATAQGEINVGSSWNTDYGYNSSSYRLLTGLYDGQSAHDAATKGQLDTAIINGGTTAPTTATVGAVGTLYSYVDTTGATPEPHLMVCTEVVPESDGTDSYVWVDVMGTVATALNIINNGSNN